MVDRLSTLHVMHSSTVTGDHCQVRHWGEGGRGERVEGRGERVEGRVYVPQTDGRQTEHVTCDGQLHSSTVTGDHCQVRHWGEGGREWKGEGREWKGESTFLRQMVDRLSTLHVMHSSTVTGDHCQVRHRGVGEGRDWKGEGRGERVEGRGERVEGRVYVPQTDGRQTEHVTCDGQLHSSTVTGDHCQVRHWGEGGRGEKVERRGERVEGRVYVPQTDGRQTEHVTCDGQLHSSTVTGDHCHVRHWGEGGRGERVEGRGERVEDESRRSSDRWSTD